MHIDKVKYPEFIEAVENATYQNQDVIEVRQFGFKSVQDAFRQSQLPWARFYLIKEKETVLATILEQRDGIVTFFTTTELPGSDIRSFVTVLKELADNIVSCRGVLFIRVASWYKPAKALLRTVGFRPNILRNEYEIWVKEHGK